MSGRKKLLELREFLSYETLFNEIVVAMHDEDANRFYSYICTLYDIKENETMESRIDRMIEEDA